MRSSNVYFASLSGSVYNIRVNILGNLELGDYINIVQCQDGGRGGEKFDKQLG